MSDEDKERRSFIFFCVCLGLALAFTATWIIAEALK